LKLQAKIARLLLVGSTLLSVGCSHEEPKAPPKAIASAPLPVLDASSPVVESEPPKPAEPPVPIRTALGLRGAELYIPTWFTAKGGRYDLIVHFHGEGRWQEANIEHAKLNVAIVSINLGTGTDPYSSAFKNPEVFERLLADVQTEIEKTGRSEGTPKLHRLALSAWSAGFTSIAKVMTDSVTNRVDAVLLADGFFTNLTDLKKRTINEKGLQRFVHFADSARKNDKLFAITHTTIPTGPYPSTQECVAKLLKTENLAKTKCSIDGPQPKMHQFYRVDDGSFHILGFEGTHAADHVRQLHAMGETTYPLLKSRWDKQDADEAR